MLLVLCQEVLVGLDMPPGDYLKIQPFKEGAELQEIAPPFFIPDVQISAEAVPPASGVATAR